MIKQTYVCDGCGKEIDDTVIEIKFGVFSKTGQSIYYGPSTDRPFGDPSRNLIGVRHFCDVKHMADFYGKSPEIAP